jgi:tRNA dimethylallyltransferase
LIDIRNPDENYSAADYARDAAEIIRNIYNRGRQPLLVGGTGLYIRAVLNGIFEGPAKDETFRANMRALAEEEGNDVVYQKLQQVDPHTAERLHPNDLVRVIRALEVFHLTGAPISSHQKTATIPLEQYKSCFLVLNTSREQLYTRINARVDHMIATGLVAEVQDLLTRGYHAALNPMKSLGYKEIVDYLAGSYDLQSATALIKRNTRHYAKRQLTWFRKCRVQAWISCNPPVSTEETVRTCLQAISDKRP